MPPKPELYFPSRANRRRLLAELKQAAAGADLDANQYYRAYVEALENLDRRMDECSAPDKNGLPRNLSVEDRDRLLEDIVKVGNAGEDLIITAQNDRKAGLTAVAPMADRLQSLLARDFEALKEYAPENGPKSLPELQAEARTQTIDLRNRNLGGMSNLQNTRIPMTFVNTKGEKRKGVFTKASHVRVKGQFLDLLERAKAQCDTQEARDELDGFLAKYREANIGRAKHHVGRIAPETSDDYMVGFLFHELYTVNENEELSRVDLIAHIPGINWALIPKKVQNTLAKGLTELKDNVSNEINAYGLELPDGARLDNRNTCMSAVASLLGVPDLLAKSVNMKFIGEDGKTTEGTFMDFGKGVDLYKKPKLFRHVGTYPFSAETRGKLFRQLADLQILDHICMNQDRHCGNLLYDLDKEGNVIGIQGIDNDSSFGTTYYPARRFNRVKVISGSMAEKLKHITPAMLKFTLRGRGLSPQELDMAATRLNHVKLAIKEKRIQVVPDKAFAKYDIDQLSVNSKEYGENIFHQMKSFFDPRERDMDLSFTPLPDQQTPDFGEVSTTSRQSTVGGLKDSLGQVGRLIRNDETGFRVEKLSSVMRGSSPEFKEMIQAARNTAALQQKLLQNKKLQDEQLLFEEGALEAYEEVNQSYEILRGKAETYLRHKAGPDGDPATVTGKNDYEQSHIDYARKLLQAVDQYKENLAPNTQEEVENFQETMTRRRIEQRRQELNPEQNQIVKQS